MTTRSPRREPAREDEAPEILTAADEIAIEHPSAPGRGRPCRRWRTADEPAFLAAEAAAATRRMDAARTTPARVREPRRAGTRGGRAAGPVRRRRSRSASRRRASTSGARRATPGAREGASAACRRPSRPPSSASARSRPPRAARRDSRPACGASKPASRDSTSACARDRPAAQGRRRPRHGAARPERTRAQAVEQRARGGTDPPRRLRTSDSDGGRRRPPSGCRSSKASCRALRGLADTPAGARGPGRGRSCASTTSSSRPSTRRPSSGRREAEDIRSQIAPLLEDRVRRHESDALLFSEMERLRESLAESLHDLAERLRSRPQRVGADSSLRRSAGLLDLPAPPRSCDRNPSSLRQSACTRTVSSR